MSRRPGRLMQRPFTQRSFLRRLAGATALAMVAAVSLAPPAFAGFADGVKAYEDGDYKGAFDAWLPLAEGGDLAAMRNIGHLYRWGQGVDRDIDKAIMWYHRAAEAGFARAQANLAAIYLQGDGVPVDYDRARKWFEAAAHQGNAVAQYNLGLMYELGLGVTVSEPVALGWYNLAAKQGQPDALNRLSLLVMQPDKAQKDAVLPRGPDEPVSPAAAKDAVPPLTPPVTATAPAAAPPAARETEAAETEPATKPVEAKPAEMKPAEPEPVDAGAATVKSAAKPAEETATETRAAATDDATPSAPDESGDGPGLLGRVYSAISSGGGVSLPDLVGATPDKDGGAGKAPEERP